MTSYSSVKEYYVAMLPNGANTFVAFGDAGQAIYSWYQVTPDYPGRTKSSWGVAPYAGNYGCDSQSEPQSGSSDVPVGIILDNNRCAYSGANINRQSVCPYGGVLSADKSYCACPSGTRYFADAASSSKCVTVTQYYFGVPPNPNNNGKACPFCGQPINPGVGNMWHTITDYAASRQSGTLELSRTYNSNAFSVDAYASRMFGRRWMTVYATRLQGEVPTPQNTPNITCWQRADTGYVWCEAPLPVVNPIQQMVSVTRSDGKRTYFANNGSSWSSTSDVNDRLSSTLTGDGTATAYYDYTAAEDDAIWRYGADGTLWSITSRSGAVQKLTYSSGTTNDTSGSRVPANAPVCSHVQTGVTLPAGLLLCVTDNWGRQLNFEYDGSGRVTKMYDPANHVTQYEYDGPSGGCTTPGGTSLACSAGNLTKVTYPDGNSQTYYYNEASQINAGTSCPNVQSIGNGFGSLLNAMTGLVDENGARMLSWTYGCGGRALSSEFADSSDKVTLAYGTYDSNGLSTTTVTHYFGDPANPQTTTTIYSYQLILGMAKNTGMSGTCIECGALKSRTYDANGNLASTTDWNNSVTVYTFDTTRNLETKRVEASGTAQARTITTQWHPSYRLPTAIAAPKKITTFAYDANGNLLTKSEQMTTDATGASGFNATITGSPRNWTYTYNAVGQVLTATDPLGNTTTYAYDAQGNLSTVTNALNQVTALSNYDAHGRVGRVVDPNGLTTDMAYFSRGWLQSKTVGGETTSYSYDSVGQLIGVTLPDGSRVSYTYDGAHRLTDVADSLGNSIHYVLDLRGNRTSEQVRDSNGTLARQVSRVYDSLNRLQTVTGGAQ